MDNSAHLCVKSLLLRPFSSVDATCVQALSGNEHVAPLPISCTPSGGVAEKWIRDRLASGRLFQFCDDPS